jgi:hypothetical protein
MKTSDTEKLVVNYCLFKFFCLFFSFLYSFCSSEKETEVIEKSKLLLSFNTRNSSEKTQCEKELFVKVYYLGVEYIISIDKHFGGQCILENTELETKYYVLVSRNIQSLKRQSIYGHKVHNKDNSKLYLFNLLTDNKKGDLTYNWEINEITIPKRQLPEKTIIIYANPETVKFETFDNNFNHPYPSKQSRFPFLMLPPCRIDVNSFLEDEYKNHICSLELKQNHVPVAAALEAEK